MTKRILYLVLIIFIFGWQFAHTQIVSAVESQQGIEPTIEDYIIKMKSSGLSIQEQKSLAVLLENGSSNSKLLEDFLSSIQNTNNQEVNNRLGKTELLIITFVVVFTLLLIWGSLLVLVFYLWQGAYLRSTRARKLGLDISP